MFNPIWPGGGGPNCPPLIFFCNSSKIVWAGKLKGEQLGFDTFYLHVLRHTAYDLFDTTTLIKLHIYEFCINLTQFYINFSRQEHLIGIVQRLGFSGFSLYPLSFLLYSPFKFLFSDILQANYKVEFYKYTIHMAFLLSVSFACI